MNHEKIFINYLKRYVDDVENELCASLHLNDMLECPIRVAFGKDRLDCIFGAMHNYDMDIDKKEAERLINLPCSVLFG